MRRCRSGAARFDRLIAAHALSLGLTLVTDNERDFADVPELTVENWTSVTWAATVLTLYPEMFPGPLGVSLAGRALAEGIWSLETVQIRDFATDKHRSVDDTPAGGGAGMVMRADVLAAAVDHVLAQRPDAPLLAMTPRGAAAHPGLRPRARRRARASRSCAAVSRGSTSGCSRPGRSSPSRSATMCSPAARSARSSCSTLAFGCSPG